MIRRLSVNRKSLWTKAVYLVGLVFLTGGCIPPRIQEIVKKGTPLVSPKGVLPTPSLSPSQSSLPSAKASFQSMVDVEWKTYENKEFGYKVSYPGNLTPRDQGKVGERVLNVTAFVGLGGEVGFTVKVTTESFASLSSLGSAVVQETSIGNQPALIKKGTNKVGDTIVTIYISDPNNRLITIVASSEVYGQELDRVIERLLKGFSFI